MLISAVMPAVSVYRLPQGQYGCSGHVINLPQDVFLFTSSLPRLPTELDVIVVRKEGSNQSHRDFCVCRAVVDQALQLLLANNVYYCAIRICIDQEALARLPEDGCLSNIRLVPLEGSAACVEADSTDDIYDTHLPQPFVPSTAPSMTEQEAVRHSVRQRQSSQSAPSASATVVWPSIGFTTEGYFSCAFPTSFPTGAADFSGQRQNQVTIGNYFKHVMMAVSPSILDSISSLSTRRCGGEHCRLVEST